MRSAPKLPLFFLSVILIFTACKKDDEKKVVAKFHPSATSVGKNESVSFINESENAGNFEWSFGDGELSYEENPVHKYTEPGKFKVKLVASSDNGVDSVSQEIRVFEVSIYEGKGVKRADLYDTWADLEAEFGSDTVYFRNYNSDFNFYSHITYYPEEGLAFAFVTENEALTEVSETFLIMIYEPYEGATAKGIAIGSNINDATEIYGEPERVEEEGYTGYWYDNLGIDFYTFDSEIIEEIDIYEPENSRKSSRSINRGILRSYLKGTE